MERQRVNRSQDEKIEAQTGALAGTVVNLPLAALEIDPQNIRGEPKIDEDFRESIKKIVVQPLIVRPVRMIEDEQVRRKLEAEGKMYTVVAGARRFEAAHQAGLEVVPCIVRELKDLDALALSIAENRHRKDIPPWRMCEAIGKLYDKLEGSREQRIHKIKEVTGIGYGTIKDYLLLKDLPESFKARLKEPSERSFSEKELLAKTSAPMSEERALIGESEQEKAPFELPSVPERIMIPLFRDKDFRQLSEKNPAKAHELLTKAAQLGRERLGQVLHQVRLLVRPRAKREKPTYPAPIPPIIISVKTTFTEDMFKALDLYKQERNLATYDEAISSILLEWFRKERSVEYIDLQAAFEDVVNEYLTNKGYFKKVMEKVER